MKDVVTICGSMRYYGKMLQAATRLTIDGKIVLMPFVTVPLVTDEQREAKQKLDELHKRKIDLSESIVVVGLHIGDSTSSEIAYAKENDVRVLYWTEHFGAMP